jgi:hypothetical protein
LSNYLANGVLCYAGAKWLESEVGIKGREMSQKTMLVVLLLTIGLAATGCAKVAEKAVEKTIEKETGAKVNIDSGKGSVEIETEEGTFSAGDNRLPEDFPKDVPIYGAATVAGAVTSTIDDNKTFVVTLATEDSVDQVADFYRAAMVKNKWSEMAAVISGEGGSASATLAYQKGDNMVTVSVSRGADNIGTHIAIGHNPK